MTSPAWFDRAELWTDEAVRRDIWQAWRRKLTQGDLLPAEETLVLDFLVTEGLIFADPVLRPELDAWSLRALQLEPQAMTLVGSRGAVLVEIGRYQEGKSLLETVLFADGAAPFDLFMSRIFLARAEHASTAGRIGGAAGPVPRDDCSSPPTINDPERPSMATLSLSDPTTEDIGKASKSRAGWHRLALTPTAHEEEKWQLKLTLVYYANPQSSSLPEGRQCGK